MDQTALPKITLFGEFTAINSVGESVAFPTRKAAALLAYLAMHVGKPVSRDVLAATIWPTSGESSAKNSLSVALSAIRKQLEPTPELERTCVVADNRSIQLVGCETDYAVFERHIRNAHRAESSTDRMASLGKAIEVYTAPLLQDFNEPWVNLERLRCEQVLFQSLCQYMDMARRPSEIHRSLNFAAQALKWDPARKDVAERSQRLKEAVKVQEEKQYRKRRQEQGLEVSDEDLVPVINQLIADDGEASAPILETPGGAVPLGSPFYIAREVDAQFIANVLQWESIVLLKGPRHIGKTSLLARAIDAARKREARVVLSDFRSYDSSFLTQPETFYSVLAESFSEQLEETIQPAEVWDSRLGPGMNFERYLRKLLQSHPERHLVWAIDEADRLFGNPFASDFFGLLRSWHNKRALEPNGPYQRITLALTYATDAHLFIQDPNQSPFNVGVRFTLSDLSMKELADLNSAYRNPVKNVMELQRLHALLGGHPFLTRSALNHLAASGQPYSLFEPSLSSPEGFFGEYLARALEPALRDPLLAAELKAMIAGGHCASSESFYRLRSAGIIVGESSQNAKVRCELFSSYLTLRTK